MEHSLATMFTNAAAKFIWEPATPFSATPDLLLSKQGVDNLRQLVVKVVGKLIPFFNGVWFLFITFRIILYWLRWSNTYGCPTLTNVLENFKAYVLKCRWRWSTLGEQYDTVSGTVSEHSGGGPPHHHEPSVFSAGLLAGPTSMELTSGNYITSLTVFFTTGVCYTG